VSKTLKPMLAASEPVTDFTKLKYPLYASPKIDGCRGMVVDGQLKSRAFKTFPNKYVHDLFSKKNFDGLDGEIIIGDPTSAQARNETSGTLNRKSDKEVDAKFYIFDCYTFKGEYAQRYLHLVELVSTLKRGPLELVVQHLISTPEELERYERDTLDLGYEGVIVRSLDGPYKYGRSTHREGYMLKVKRFLDAEAEILEVIEEMENTNDANKDAFGRTKRSHAQEGMVPKGRTGALRVKDVTTGVEFVVGSGYDDTDRDFLWNNKRKLVGKLITYKYFPHGVKDKPLLPVYVGPREDWDL
jgi:DNA ligase-1